MISKCKKNKPNPLVRSEIEKFMGSSYSGTEFIADLVLIQSLLSDKRMAVTTGSGRS